MIKETTINTQLDELYELVQLTRKDNMGNLELIDRLEKSHKGLTETFADVQELIRKNRARVYATNRRVKQLEESTDGITRGRIKEVEINAGRAVNDTREIIKRITELEVSIGDLNYNAEHCSRRIGKLEANKWWQFWR